MLLLECATGVSLTLLSGQRLQCICVNWVAMEQAFFMTCAVINVFFLSGTNTMLLVL